MKDRTAKWAGCGGSHKAKRSGDVCVDSYLWNRRRPGALTRRGTFLTEGERKQKSISMKGLQAKEFNVTVTRDAFWMGPRRNVGRRGPDSG